MGYYVNWLLDNYPSEQEVKRLCEHLEISEEDYYMDLLTGNYESKAGILISGIENFSKEFPSKEYLLYGVGEDSERFKYKIKNGETTSYKPIITWQEQGLSTESMGREDVVNELVSNYPDSIDTMKLAVLETTELRELLHDLRDKKYDRGRIKECI